MGEWDRLVEAALSSLASAKQLTRSTRPISLLAAVGPTPEIETFDGPKHWDRSSVEVEMDGRTVRRWLQELHNPAGGEEADGNEGETTRRKLILFSGNDYLGLSTHPSFSLPWVKRDAYPAFARSGVWLTGSEPPCLDFDEPVRGAKGPISEDGPKSEIAILHSRIYGVGLPCLDLDVHVRGAKGSVLEKLLKAFEAVEGVVPLSVRSLAPKERLPAEPEQVPQFNPLAAKAASISLSSLGVGGFDFSSNPNKKSKPNNKSSQRGCNSSHEAMSNASLQTGRFLIGKSYAVSSVQPTVAKASQRPPGAKSRRPTATVAARAALARTARAKNFWPQPPHVKMLAVALLAMALNVPLGAWREHTQKYSPQWFAAACAAVPFVGMLAESEAMPKTAMAFNLAASILGQTMGARAERRRLKAQAAEQQTATSTNETGHCREEKAGEPSLPSKGNGSMHPSETPAPAPEGKRVFQNVFNFNLCSPVSQTYF